MVRHGCARRTRLAVFCTFFGLDAIRKSRQTGVKVATVGTPGTHIPTVVGALPGISGLATRMMRRQLERLDIPPIPEFIEPVSDSGAGHYACKASADMFKLTKIEFVEQVDEILAAGECYALAARGEIVFI